MTKVKVEVASTERSGKGVSVMKKETVGTIGFVSVLTVLITCSQGGNAMNRTVFPKGVQGPREFFTNTTWVNMLHTDEGGTFDTQVGDVIFEPFARTFWHSHPGGQILLITSGTGYYQERGRPARLLESGDVVTIPPDVVHWHGAAPKNHLVHIGMSTKVHEGPAEWFGPVTDEEYGAATAE